MKGEGNCLFKHLSSRAQKNFGMTQKHTGRNLHPLKRKGTERTFAYQVLRKADYQRSQKEGHCSQTFICRKDFSFQSCLFPWTTVQIAVQTKCSVQTWTSRHWISHQAGSKEIYFFISVEFLYPYCWEGRLEILNNIGISQLLRGLIFF